MLGRRCHQFFLQPSQELVVFAVEFIHGLLYHRRAGKLDVASKRTFSAGFLFLKVSEILAFLSLYQRRYDTNVALRPKLRLDHHMYGIVGFVGVHLRGGHATGSL